MPREREGESEKVLKIAQTDVKNNTGTYTCTLHCTHARVLQKIFLGGEQLFCIIWYWMCAEHAASGGGGGGPTVSQHVCLLPGAHEPRGAHALLLLRIKLISPYMYAVLRVTAIIIIMLSTF